MPQNQQAGKITVRVADTPIRIRGPMAEIPVRISSNAPLGVRAMVAPGPPGKPGADGNDGADGAPLAPGTILNGGFF